MPAGLPRGAAATATGPCGPARAPNSTERDSPDRSPRAISTPPCRACCLPASSSPASPSSHVRMPRESWSRCLRLQGCCCWCCFRTRSTVRCSRCWRRFHCGRHL